MKEQRFVFKSQIVKCEKSYRLLKHMSTLKRHIKAKTILFIKGIIHF